MKPPDAVIRVTTAVACGLLLAGCAGERSVLDPQSPSSERAATLAWIMIVAATVVTLGVFALLAYGLFRRRDGGEARRWRASHWIVGGGIVLPVVVIAPIAVLGVAAVGEDAGADFEVEVTGHQYWWEFRYPDSGVVTANELHIPVGVPVSLELRSDDVVHSFWVPRLGGKIDLVPGHENVLTIEADEPGVYYGQCAEYCGIQHAKMRLLVVADTAEDFERWVANQVEPADRPRDPGAARGQELFASQGCASCHTVRGTDAMGELGPDLTHVADRMTIAAGVLPNTRDDLRLWLDETWEVKDRAFMPELPLTDEMIESLVEYLETLE